MLVQSAEHAAARALQSDPTAPSRVEAKDLAMA